MQNDRYFFERDYRFWGWPDALRLQGSILPTILPQVSLIFLFSLGVCIAYLELGYTNLSIAGSVIPSLSVVLGLLIAFRTNSAYDRFWEGRKVWSSIQTQARVMTRIIWLQIPETQLPNMTGPPVSKQEKKQVVWMLLGAIMGIKHRARKQKGTVYSDYEGLLPKSIVEQDRIDNHKMVVCTDLTYRLTRYFDFLVNRSTIPYATYASLASGLAILQDCESSIDRIRGTPIPLAYLIHMKQAVTLYCCTLPFTMIEQSGYLTPFFVALVAFTLLGIGMNLRQFF